MKQIFFGSLFVKIIQNKVVLAQKSQQDQQQQQDQRLVSLFSTPNKLQVCIKALEIWGPVFVS